MAKSKRTMTLELTDADLAEAVEWWAARNGLLSATESLPTKRTVAIRVDAVTKAFGEHAEHVGRVVLTESCE